MDWNGDWTWSDIPRAELESLIGVLKSFESSTWKNLMQEKVKGKKKHHFMPLDAICKNALRRLETLEQDDIGDDQLFSFHIMQKKRLWGIVDRHIFKILWWDPEHTVYPMDIADNSN